MDELEVAVKNVMKLLKMALKHRNSRGRVLACWNELSIHLRVINDILEWCCKGEKDV